MPIYEYECDKCGHEFEREQRMSDPPVKTCPKCKGRKVTKLISQTSFVLKGGGWYADGYSDAKGGKSADASSGSDASSDSSPSAPAADDSKSKPKPDTKSKDTGSKDTKAKASKKSAA